MRHSVSSLLLFYQILNLNDMLKFLLHSVAILTCGIVIDNYEIVIKFPLYGIEPIPIDVLVNKF